MTNRLRRTITMEDGRTVVFRGKVKTIYETLQGPHGRTIRVSFIDGKVRTFPLAAEDGWRYACYGAIELYRRFGPKLADIEALAERLARKEWPEGPRQPMLYKRRTDPVIMGMCQVTGQSVDEVRAYLKEQLDHINRPFVVLGRRPIMTRAALYAQVRASKKFGAAIAAIENKPWG